MVKKGELEYYKNIGKAGLEFSIEKPYSDRVNAGELLTSLGAIFTQIHNSFGENAIRILDLGCGTGWSSNLFALSGHEVVGIDVSKDAINAAKKKFNRSNLSFEKVDYNNLSSLGLFDVAIFIDSLHHADDIEAVLRSVKKILKSGGICIICEPGKGHSTSPDAIEAVEKYGVNEKDLPPKLTTKLAKNAGFTTYKVYSHPAKLQKVNYKVFHSGKKAILFSNSIGRVAGNIYVSTMGKRNDGLIVLYND